MVNFFANLKLKYYNNYQKFAISNIDEKKIKSSEFKKIGERNILFKRRLERGVAKCFVYFCGF